MNSKINDENISKDDLIDLKNALNSLTSDEKNLINARYFNNYTQQELARIYHTNQVKISREEKKILCKLDKKCFKSLKIVINYIVALYEEGKIMRLVM